MISEHPLLAMSHRFPASDSPAVDPAWRYRRDWGVWVETAEPSSLMVSPAETSRLGETRTRPHASAPVSKKADRETGEDMKGA